MRIGLEHELMAETSTRLPGARSVVVFAPHPDDEVFGCGATLALLHEAGAKIAIHIITDGSQGGANQDGQLAAVRANESRAALKCLGLPMPELWQLPDRSLTYEENLIEKLRRVVQQTHADLIFLPSPIELHPDHQALGLAGVEALRRAAGKRQIVFYEVGAPLLHPNLLIDISAKEELKWKAMNCFASQLSEQAYADQIAGLNRYRSYSMGATVGSAEAFYCVNAAESAVALAALTCGQSFYRRQLGMAVTPDDIPLVSVILLSLNRSTLDDTLGALALQTYPNIEVLLVTARGGNPSPGEVCGRFPLRAFPPAGTEMGSAQAGNLALGACRGQLVCFVNDDMVLAPDYIDHLVSRSQTLGKEQVLFVAPQADLGIEEGGANGKKEALSINFSDVLLNKDLPLQAVFFPANLLRQGVAFDETLDALQDWDFLLQLSRRSSFHRVAGISVSYDSQGMFTATIPESKAKADLYDKWFAQLSRDDVLQLIEYFQRTLSETNRRAADLENRCADLERQLHTSASQFAELANSSERQLKAVLHSRSWRLTRPLRWAGRLLRGQDPQSTEES